MPTAPAAPTASPQVQAQPVVPAAAPTSQPAPRPQLGPLLAPAAPEQSAKPPHIPARDEGVQLPAVKSHLPGWATGLLGVAGVGTVALGLFVASEAGWISLGIENLWSISNNPKNAFAGAGAALAGTSQYAVDGQVAVAFGNSETALPALSPRGQAVLADAATSETGRVLGARTAQANAGPPSPSEPGAITLLFAQSVSGEQGALESQWTVGPSVSSSLLGSRFVGGGTLRLNTVTEGDALYVQLPSALGADEAWGKATLTELGAFNLQPLDWPKLFEAVGANYESGKRLPGKTLNGVRTKGYELQVPANLLAESIVPSTTKFPGTLTLQAWLGTADNRPYLVTIAGDSGSGSVNARLVFHAYGQSQTITVPATATSITLSSWVEQEGIIQVDSPASRDAIRKADLERIKTALQSYAQAQSPFSYPKTSAVSRLDQAQEVQAALKPYLESIPVDPLGPERYYGYQSDGTTFTLTAVLEESNDPAGAKQGDLTLLRVTP